MEMVKPVVEGMQEVQQQTLFKELMAKHKGLLFKVIRSFASEPSDQDDLLQEISVQLWHALPSFRGESKVTTWMYKIALFAAISWRKKEQKHSDTQTLFIQSGDFQDETQSSPTEELEQMFSMIRQLNDIDRSITLLMLEGYSYEDVGKVLGISTSNVGVKINRIKKKLSSMSQGNNDGV